MTRCLRLIEEEGVVSPLIDAGTGRGGERERSSRGCMGAGASAVKLGGTCGGRRRRRASQESPQSKRGKRQQDERQHASKVPKERW